ncbi:MAG: AI-2E family transporter [Clostridiales bacterium]|nr:AI-2E family transporter [Clostridiales bacterium]
MLDLNKETVKKVLLIIAFTLLFYTGLNHIPEVLRTVGILIGLLSPFLLGSCIAFILNVPMRFIEKKLLKNTKLKPSLKRTVSLILALLFIIAVILFVFLLVIPELANTIRGLFISVPRALDHFQIWLLSLDIPWPQIQDKIANWNWDLEWGTLINQVFNFFKTGFMGSIFTTVGVVTSIVSGFVNFFIGFVFAIYILCQKEKLARQAKKVCYATFPIKVADRIVYIVTLTEKTFSNFLTGQCIEAVILGSMFFVAMTILKFPFALLVGVLIAVTALIPIVGAFLGCAVAMFLILTVNPIQVIWFFILFNVLQQFEGNVIYPRVVGSSVGLPAMWVLVAVTLGGSMLGIVGMLIYIPLFSVIYSLLREHINKKLRVEKVPPDKWKLKDE